MRFGHEYRGQSRRAWRGASGVVIAALGFFVLGPGCDDSIDPAPPKQGNRTPESTILVQADSLAPQFYKLALNWLGSDPDGRVAGYNIRWQCIDTPGVANCTDPAPWLFTIATRATFILPVPEGTATYRFDVAAVDDEGAADPTPASQVFTFHNAAPVVAFQASTLPTVTLPAVTFYAEAVDPDSSANPNDHDAAGTIAQYRAWLDGDEANAHTVAAALSGVTFGPEDFQGRYGPRTVFLKAIDTGGQASAAVQHTWQVNAPPDQGILLVDDCRMGGFLEQFSDASYRNALDAVAPGRTVVMDVETIPRLGRADLEATLSLFHDVVWYTDADTVSSGALELARAGLDSLLSRGGNLLLVGGLAFGTRGAFGPEEPRFRDLFGIETVFRGPNGSTNFALSLEDTVHAVVTPAVTRFHFLSFGLRAVMECFGSRQDAVTRSLYFYPESTFVRATADTLQPFVNTVQFDVGVQHQLAAGGHTIYVSFPLGLPINDNLGENEAEIRELLRLAGMVP